ncbi:mRNA splicing protein prp28 [Mucor velutinosus]|uniref:mRNA splicing protein prp28 n=1 Tax=Mucor velutinosus TaxID=708070 RepID=A0AAN7DNZ4_9FUNG|nr:mRNA splicing protein prp28 [Mucor velutinosus]
MTTEGGDNNNSIVILSDDDEDAVALNKNGKRPRPPHHANQSNPHTRNQRLTYDDDEEGYYDDEDEGMDTEDEEYALYEQQEIKRNASYLNRSLPEDHEPVIVSERDQINALQEINDIFQQLKGKVLSANASVKEVEPSYSCGGLLNEEAPNIAMNVSGVSGPIAFPMDEKDATRILQVHAASVVSNDKGEPIRLNLDVAQIEINKTFEEYLSQNLLLDVVEYLGVDSVVAKNTTLVANQFHIVANGGTLTLSDSLNEAAYGTVVLVLPTDFCGGEVSISYSDDQVSYQPEEAAFECCYYMAWYNNVKTQFEPVLEGHQLAISFSLIHNDTVDKATSDYLQKRRLQIANGELTPAEMEQNKPYIGRAVTWFKENSAERPFPIFFMLDYKYGAPSLCVDDLKRPDKTLAKVLKQAADEADFLMYLGTVEREVEGTVYEEGRPHDVTNKKEGDDCPMDEEGIYLTQRAIYDEYVLKKLFNESGKNILETSVGLDSSDHPAIIQGPRWYSRCKPMNVAYSGTVEVEDVTVKYFYAECQALVFLPKSRLSSLVKMSNKEPTEKDDTHTTVTTTTTTTTTATTAIAFTESNK